MQEFNSALAAVIADVVEPQARHVDQEGAFPRASIDALAKIGVLGLVSAKELGGLGQTLRAAAGVVEQVSKACASTGMVLCMHFAGVGMLEQVGPRGTREAIATGRHLTTLAFSEPGSRSQFWATDNTATADGDNVRIDGTKSWITSAGHADSIAWSTRPLAAEGASTMWLLPGKAPGLKVAGRFDGFGLRGNASSPVSAEGVVVPKSAILGEDGKGGDVMNLVLPWFQVLNSACSIGTMEATIAKSIAHITGTRFAHTGLPIADLMTVRAYLARMRMKADMVRALLLDTLSALEGGREDTMIKVFEIKAAAGETASEVTDLGMRICGGAAFRKDVGVERHFRDARASVVMTPTADLIYDYVGKMLCGLPL